MKLLVFDGFPNGSKVCNCSAPLPPFNVVLIPTYAQLILICISDDL